MLYCLFADMTDGMGLGDVESKDLSFLLCDVGVVAADARCAPVSSVSRLVLQ